MSDDMTPTPEDLARCDLPRELSGGILKRFVASVAVTPAGCWRWHGGAYDNGYGRISVDGRDVLVHRLAYRAMVGEIPPGLTIDHLCNNRLCVNPDHLALATRADNTRRGDGSPRPTRCPRGHEYAGDNVRINAGGDRHCRACDRERARVKRFREPAKVREASRRSYLKHKEKYLERRRAERRGDAPLAG